MANQEFWGSCEYSAHVSRNGQQWIYRNAVQISIFTKSRCIHIYIQSGRDRLYSHCCKPCGYNPDVLGIKQVAAGMCTSWPVRPKHSPTQMVTLYRSWWLWWPCELSSSPLWSHWNESSTWLDELTKHHNVDDLLNSGDLSVMSWLEVRISLWQGLWCNLTLFLLAPWVINWPCVAVTCLTIWYNRHTFA